MLRKNLKTAFNNSGMIVKDIAEKSGVKKRTIDKWVGAEETEPKVNDLYKVCKTLGITVEWAVAGEDGLNYVRDLLAKEGKLWEAPEKIQSIVDVLETLDDDTLRIVKTMIMPLKQEDTPVDFLNVRESVPEYNPVAINISRFIPKSDRADSAQSIDWEMIMLPFYGNTAAGNPINVSYYPDQAIPFPKQKLKGNPDEYFSVRIKGTSMSQAGINDGDYVIIRRAEEPRNGKIMLVRYENSSTLKRIKIKESKKDGREVYLYWEDGSGDFKLVDSTEYEVQGEFYRSLGQ